MCSLDVPPQVHSTDTTAQLYITQKCFTDLLEICHHSGVLYIFLKSLKIYGGDLDFFRTSCFTLLNTKERGKIAIWRNLEQWLWRGQKQENVLRLDCNEWGGGCWKAEEPPELWGTSSSSLLPGHINPACLRSPTSSIPTQSGLSFIGSSYLKIPKGLEHGYFKLNLLPRLILNYCGRICLWGGNLQDKRERWVESFNQQPN